MGHIVLHYEGTINIVIQITLFPSNVQKAQPRCERRGRAVSGSIGSVWPKVDQKDIWLKHFLIKCPLHWKSQRNHSTTSIDTEKTTEIV